MRIARSLSGSACAKGGYFRCTEARNEMKRNGKTGKCDVEFRFMYHLVSVESQLDREISRKFVRKLWTTSRGTSLFCFERHMRNFLSISAFLHLVFSLPSTEINDRKPNYKCKRHHFRLVCWFWKKNLLSVTVIPTGCFRHTCSDAHIYSAAVPWRRLSKHAICGESFYFMVYCKT